MDDYEDDTDDAVSISGAPTDEGMSWGLYCTLCELSIGERSYNADDLKPALLEHRLTHKQGR